MRHRILFLSIALALVPQSARAQSSGPDASAKPVLSRPLADAMTKKARELFSEGVQAAAQGRLADARAAFVGADALSPHYSNLCNLGDVELRLGRFVEAATDLRTCSDGLQGDAKATGAERDGAKKLLQKAKEKVLEIAIAAPAGAAAPPRVAVTLDGAPAGSAPPAMTVFVSAGKHVVQLDADGYQGEAIEVEGAAGARKEVQVALKRKAAAVPTATASAAVTAPLATTGPRKEIVLAGAVITGIGLAVGIGTGIAALGAAGDARKQLDAVRAMGPCNDPPDTPACTSLQAKVKEQETLTNTAFFSFAGAGIAGVATTIYVLAMRPEKPASGVMVAPIIGATGGQLAITGRF